VLDYLENSTLVGQPQAQELMEIKSFSNIITQRRKNNRSQEVKINRIRHSYCMVCYYRATLDKLLSTIFMCLHENFLEVFIFVIKLGNLQNEAYEHF
jgi:hypothetical protein